MIRPTQALLIRQAHPKAATIQLPKILKALNAIQQNTLAIYNREATSTGISQEYLEKLILQKHAAHAEGKKEGSQDVFFYGFAAGAVVYGLVRIFPIENKDYLENQGKRYMDLWNRAQEAQGNPPITTSAPTDLAPSHQEEKIPQETTPGSVDVVKEKVEK